VIVIDTSVWIPLLNGIDHPKADRARAIIEGPEEVVVPGIILEETLRGGELEELPGRVPERPRSFS
jgi:predicted nucleic acid-binding protein